MMCLFTHAAKIKKNPPHTFNLYAEGREFDVIVTSGLQRAQETAALIAKEVGYDGSIVTMPELNERNGGAYQGGRHPEVL